METNEVLKLFSTTKHKCVEFKVFGENDDPGLELYFESRNMRNKYDYVEYEDVLATPVVVYNKTLNEIFYCEDIYVNGINVDTIYRVDPTGEFSQAEIDYIENTIREYFDKI